MRENYGINSAIMYAIILHSLMIPIFESENVRICSKKDNWI